MAFHFLRRVVTLANRRVTRTRPKYRPGLEYLEGRRLLNAGGLDPTFGVGGKVLTDFAFPIELTGSDIAHQAAIRQGDGKIVVVGNSNTLLASDELVMARYNTNGSLDTSFGNQGRVRDTFPTFSAATSLPLQSNGKIVVAGYSFGNNGSDFFVARYNSNGTL